MDIVDYLKINDISINENYFKKENILSCNNNSIEQINLIVETQKRIMGNKENFMPRINSILGKEIESKKIYLRKSTKYIEHLKNKSNRSEFENYIIEEGNKVIYSAQKAINAVIKDEYLNLIKRSMNNYEMTIGRVDEGSLAIDNNNIIMRTTKYIAYNMIENDCYSYIRKLKRKGEIHKIECTIQEFIYLSDLDKISANYISLLTDYPLESIKILLKIRNEKEKFTEEQWIKQIKISRNIDGLLF